jgi:heme/copper-type cytochrome/quinol oxidase subunit 3
MAVRARTVEHGAPTSTGLSNVKLGMWAFLGSECLLFGALISTFILFRNRPVTGLRPQDIYDIPFTSVSSFVLLMSSLTWCWPCRPSSGETRPSSGCG